VSKRGGRSAPAAAGGEGVDQEPEMPPVLDPIDEPSEGDSAPAAAGGEGVPLRFGECVMLATRKHQRRTFLSGEVIDAAELTDEGLEEVISKGWAAFVDDGTVGS
jgi:hypothetical protein